MQRFKLYLSIALISKGIIISRSFTNPRLNVAVNIFGAKGHNSALYSTEPDIGNQNVNVEINIEEGNKDYEEGPLKIISPLKFVGPYPSLALHFPNLSTASQRKRGVLGISLDFVLDTAANTNTINAQVASELKLESIGTALPGYNTAGTMDGGTTFTLGDCTLDTSEKKTEEIFMKGLSASALPVASPTGAGLLGVSFLNCFQGGVKFDWGSKDSVSTVTFYGDDTDMEDDTTGMTKVPIKVIEDILLPSVTLKINGKEIPALLDTGSPITVLNSAAADLAELNVVELTKNEENDSNGSTSSTFMNPFKKFAENVKNANSLAQAVSKGDILMIAGAGGQPIQLIRTDNAVELSLKGEIEDVSFSAHKIYVGDLPGLAALGGLNSISSPPAAILGMDVLKRKSSMLYRTHEVYF